MKIAFFVHCFFPGHCYGTETYTFELAKQYLLAGHQVTVVSALFQGEPTQGSLITRYEFQGVPVVQIDKNFVPHARVGETYYQPAMHEVLMQVLKELHPDLIHVTHLINHTAALLEVAQTLGIPAYATFTDFFGFCLNNKLENASGALCKGPSPSRANCVACHLKAAAPQASAGSWLRHAKNSNVALAMGHSARWARRLPRLQNTEFDHVIADIEARPNTLVALYNSSYKAAVAPTRFLAGAYQRNGVQVPLHNIHFGVDIDRAAKPSRPAGYTPVVGYIGQLAPHKGTDLLLRAFKRLGKSNARLQIFGPTDQDPAHMMELKALAQGVNVEFKGVFPKEHISAVLKDIDLLVIPSRWYENSPLVLLNALATHTPVLVADVAGMTEFLSPGKNGCAFERGNIDALHAELARLLSAPEQLLEMSKTTFFDKTPHTMALETLALY